MQDERGCAALSRTACPARARRGLQPFRRRGRPDGRCAARPVCLRRPPACCSAGPWQKSAVGPRIPARETIRATVIGAGCHATELSGSTVYFDRIAFPLKKSARRRPDAGGRALPARAAAQTVRARLAVFADGPAVLALQGRRDLRFAALSALADGLAGGLAAGTARCSWPWRPMWAGPGQALAVRMPGVPLLCLDGVQLPPGSYPRCRRPHRKRTGPPGRDQNAGFEGYGIAGRTCPSRRRTAAINRLSLNGKSQRFVIARRPTADVGNLRKATYRSYKPSPTARAANLTVAAVSDRLVQSHSTAGGHWCTAALPDVSLRGAKRRGNLAVHSWITGRPRRKRNCLPEIAPKGTSRASRSGRHVGRWPPRNDKSGEPHAISFVPQPFPAAPTISRANYIFPIESERI